MRFVLPLGTWSLLILTGCATITPREYLDEETAATITVTPKPWTFIASNSQTGFNNREFLDLYALDINRAGEHRQYLAVMRSLLDSTRQSNNTSSSDTPRLAMELETSERTITLNPATQTPRQLGIAKPLAQPFALDTRWWYFPASKEDLAVIAQSTNLVITFSTATQRVSYVVFRDGRAELAELSAKLQ